MTLVIMVMGDFYTNAATAAVVGTQADNAMGVVAWVFVIDQIPQYVVIIHTTVVDWAPVLMWNTTTQIVQHCVRLSLAVHI